MPNASAVAKQRRIFRKEICTVAKADAEHLASYLGTEGAYAVFSAKLAGVPMRKEYLTEPFALRAYIRCGGVTYYSSVKRESVCSAVKKAIAADMAYADDPYAAAVMAVCEEN